MGNLATNCVQLRLISPFSPLFGLHSYGLRVGLGFPYSKRTPKPTLSAYAFNKFNFVGLVLQHFSQLFLLLISQQNYWSHIL